MLKKSHIHVAVTAGLIATLSLGTVPALSWADSAGAETPAASQGETVEESSPCIAELNGKQYESLQDAIDAAQDGDTVYVLDNGDLGAGRYQTATVSHKSITLEGKSEYGYVALYCSLTLDHADGTTVRKLSFDSGYVNPDPVELVVDSLITVKDSSDITIDDCQFDIGIGYIAGFEGNIVMAGNADLDRAAVRVVGDSDNVSIGATEGISLFFDTLNNLIPDYEMPESVLEHTYDLAGIKVEGSDAGVDGLKIANIVALVYGYGGSASYDDETSSQTGYDQLTVKVVDIAGNLSGSGEYGVNDVTVDSVEVRNNSGMNNRVSNIYGICVTNADGVVLTGKEGSWEDPSGVLSKLGGYAGIVLGDESSGENGSVTIGQLGFNSYIGAKRYENGGTVTFDDPAPEISDIVVIPYEGFDEYPGSDEPDTPEPDPGPEPDPMPDPDVPVTPTPDVDVTEDVSIADVAGGSVQLEPTAAGEPTVIVVDPDEGQELREIVVTDVDGNEVKITANEDGTFTFVMPEGGVTVTAVFGCDGGELCETHAFTDIDQDQWYHDAVDWAIDNEVFHGYGDGTFGPNDILTREQAAAVLYNYLGGEPGSEASGLGDVADGWYTEAVNWAVANGVMNGYDGTDTFGIGDALTREQFCAVVANAVEANLEDGDLSVLDAFPDSEEISDWARPAVAWAVQQGILNGVENDDGMRTLQGVRDITRAEMAAMMQNAVDAGVLTE